jgi:NADPH2:quinone reductase
MRAAVLTEHGRPPEVVERDAPAAAEGRAVVELRAAGLNPIDVNVASGRFPGGSPPMPYVPGAEGVGTVVESARFAPGTIVYASGGGLGVATDGTFRERFDAPDSSLIEVPDGVEPTIAAAFGVAGLAGFVPLSWLAPVRSGETVLVLGATGSVGAVAVQTAKLLGAGRVVAAGRDEARLERSRSLGADDVVQIGSDDDAARLAEVFGDSPPTLVFDVLWGEPAAAACAVAARGARIVNLGQSAGPGATLLSGHVRLKALQILGYSNFGVPPDDLASEYRKLLEHASAGRIRLDVETVPLDRVADAWSRQAAGGGTKLVLLP